MVTESYAVWNTDNADWQSVPDVLDVSDYWSLADATEQREYDAREYVAEGYYESIDDALSVMEVRPYPPNVTSHRLRNLYR